jgi:hypothetical protein
MRPFLLTVSVAFLSFLNLSIAQEHSHEGTVGRFYERWTMPNNRFVSCCNNKDCAPVEHVRRSPDGQLQMQRKSDGEWLTIPPEKLEQNYPDAFDSPDGFSHMCSANQSVYCAVLGSGI